MPDTPTTDPIRHIALPMLEHTLGRAAHLLQRAEQHVAGTGLAPAELLFLRLAPDMLCLAHQVQILADSLDGARALLCGDTAAPTAAWVFNRGDEALFRPPDTRLDDAMQRLDVARQGYRAVTPSTALLGAADTVVVRRPGDARRFGVHDFVWRYVVPNAHFHATIIYALLRSAGVPLGKADFEGAAAYTIPPEGAG